MQGVIFHENSRKVDEHFSLFFVKNFTETKESHFGYVLWKFTQTRIDDFAIFSRKYAAAEIGLSKV